uniref:WAP domain-containing protein n=1 Tax=Macrostomum lignano TaxID=282301 RepID=A0A1I8I894_9PLAT
KRINCWEMRAADDARLSLTLLLLPPLLLNIWTASAAAAAAAPRSAVISELLGPADSRQQRPPAAPGGSTDRLRQPDPSPSRAGLTGRRLTGDNGVAVSWRLSESGAGLLWRNVATSATARGAALAPHARDKRLGRPDPYRELASEAYHRFLFGPSWRCGTAWWRCTASMRPLLFASSSRTSRRATAAATPRPAPRRPGGPEMTPSPPVRVCPPRWRLGDHRCKANATFCYKDSECPADSRCCFDGCKLRCLEPELLVKHVCRDYANSTAYPGDLYMHRREQICTCDELGRPAGCKDKKPCIDVISSSLFKLPFINNKTVKLKKRERTTRQKIYDALQKAFKHVKKVY